MVKKHLLALIDIRLIVFLVAIIAVSFILTMVFSDKIKEFAVQYKRKFYIYVFSFVLIYALVGFLGYNKLFTELSDEFRFYQIASLLFGILNVYLYRWYFNEFNKKGSVGIELLFSLLITLYSSVLFVIIYTALNGIALTFLMCSHFLVFIVPTGVYAVFNYMMQIPPKEYVTWRIPERKNPFPEIENVQMKDLLLITLLIQKKESDTKYTSIRSKGPVRIDFGALFYHTVSGYNEHNAESKIDLKHNGENYNWVFFLQPKWYQTAKYVDAKYTLGMNGITENSVIICKRQRVKEITQTKKEGKGKDFMFEPKMENKEKEVEV
ncbi:MULTISPECIES: TssN family type VI secretion system protein [Flavobacterium]|uniref:TssN family type VI secretion system protein n=1 Tax=Flavobacterium TaxID=237 RepID=UPI00202EC0CC|nr:MULTISPECIES: TssN family type VI secretion system protein [Flavobacterium]MCM0666435.1 TssN family type VI secretion system protein [Flavobacterium tyrosinilyticum]MDY0989819.1 TssN family type VI secretion system protein [Flavobacterium sp. CFBP9031]